jgi:putative transcriptional regulator
MTRKSISVEQRLNETINEMAQGLYELNVIDRITMRDYQSLDIPEVHDLTPQEIKKIRLKEKVSQAIFAKYLNATVHTIQDWEQGKKHPRGTSLKLLNMVLAKGLEALS